MELEKESAIIETILFLESEPVAEKTLAKVYKKVGFIPR